MQEFIDGKVKSKELDFSKIERIPVHMMALEKDDTCTVESAQRIYKELKKNDEDNMHSMETIKDVDHLYFTWVSDVEFVDNLAAIIEKQASSLVMSGVLAASLALAALI